MSLRDAEKYIGARARALQKTWDDYDNVTDQAAYATGVALEHGLIAGPNVPKGQKPKYTSETFVVYITGGRSDTKSMVTGWKHLWHAMNLPGMSVDHDTYKRLRKSNAYGQGPVVTALYKSNANEASIAKAIRPFATPDGQRIKPKRKARTTKKAEPVKMTSRALNKAVKDLTADLQRHVEALDLNGWGAWETAFRTYLDKQNTSRNAEVAKAAKAS